MSESAARHGGLVLHGGPIATLEEARPEVGGIVIRDGRVAFLGGVEEARRVGAGLPELDSRGRRALPGFIDSHVHFWRTGLLEQMVDLREVGSTPALIAALRKRARQTPPGVLVMGRGFSELVLAERRYPRRAELDEVSREHPVYVMHRKGHSCAVNSVALALLALDPATPGVERDPATGEPTGALREKIAVTAQGQLMTRLDPVLSRSCLAIASALAVAQGVTTVHCLEGGRLLGDPDVADLLQEQANLPISTVLYYQITDIGRVTGLGLPRIGGCVLIDGSPAAHTGALYEPYAERPDTIGLEYWKQTELDEWVWQAHRRGMQLTAHATCERAIG